MRGGIGAGIAAQVCEMFDVSPPLVPAARRELLAALLGELRDCHFARGAGCSPSPLSMTPLSVDTALTNKVCVCGRQAGRQAMRRA